MVHTTITSIGISHGVVVLNRVDQKIVVGCFTRVPLTMFGVSTKSFNAIYVGGASTKAPAMGHFEEHEDVEL